ncbi:MAG: hypothetical protein RLZZ297_721 [Chloroflexota bacterium]|jgi:hypothetical protein
MPIGMHEVQLDLVVALRKPHACGTNQWRVVRLGADIGVRCEHCRHRVLLPRSAFERAVTTIISRPPPTTLEQP